MHFQKSYFMFAELQMLPYVLNAKVLWIHFENTIVLPIFFDY